MSHPAIPDANDRGPRAIQSRPIPHRDIDRDIDRDLDTLANHFNACECCGRTCPIGQDYCHRCGGRSPFPRRRMKFKDED